MSSFYDWVADRAAEKNADEAKSDAGIARMVGVSQSTVLRWARGSDPREPEMIRQIATGLGIHVSKVLIEIGYLTEAEAQVREIPGPPSMLADTDLIREIERRLARASDQVQVRPAVAGSVRSRMADRRQPVDGGVEHARKKDA